MAVKKIEALNKHENPATNENQFDIENYMNVNWDKIREVVDNNADELTTTQGKVTTLETDNKKNKQDISDIKSNQTTQNDLLERTQSALINITTEKSSNINVKDSSNLNAKIGVFGISEQETREGYNLLNVASTCEITGSKTVPISMPAGNYTIKADDITTDSEQTQFCFSFRDSSGTIADARISLSTKKITFALTREATSVNVYSGNSFNESQGVTTTYTNLMIYEGADDKTYEEYGASPSPEFPSEIENVTGNIDITILNKNFFDENNSNNFKDGIGVDLTTKNDNGTFTTTSNFSVSRNKGTKIVGLKANTDYIVSLSITNITSAGRKNAEIEILTSSNGVSGFTPVVQKTVGTGTSTLEFNSSNYKYLFLHISGYTEIENTISVTFKDILIAEKSNDNTYVPHEEQLITFPLSEGQKLYDKDYPASDGIHHVRKQIELDGTENWFQNETTKVFGFALSDIKTEGAFNSSARIVVMSDYFKAAKYYQLYYGEVDEAISGHDSSQAVELRATRFTTIEELKTWLTEQKEAGTPVILEYELAEEEIEPYTKEQQEAYNKLQNVLSYKTETNVFTDKAQLVFKYIADTETWAVNLVKNEIANTNQQLLNIAGGN